MMAAAAPRYGPSWSLKSRNKRTLHRRRIAAARWQLQLLTSTAVFSRVRASIRSMHRLSDYVLDRSPPEPAVPSGCLAGRDGLRANRVEEDLDQRKLRELRKPRMERSRRCL